MLIAPTHDGRPPAPHDALAAWTFSPSVVVPLAIVAALYWRGWRPADGASRAWAWWAGWTTLVVALVSPVDAVSGILLSAHMVQHVLLVVIAAPLLATAAPGAALVRGVPGRLRRPGNALARRAGVGHPVTRRLRGPVWRWLAFVLSFWLWHASVLYGAAVEHEWVHALEHATFFGTGLLLWSVVLGPRRVRLERGPGVLFVFLVGLQSVLLSALITFAQEPWYDEYVGAAPGWGLDALADQQLAGVIMWVPTGLVTAAIAIWLLVTWLRDIDGDRGDDRDDGGHRRTEPTGRNRIESAEMGSVRA